MDEKYSIEHLDEKIDHADDFMVELPEEKIFYDDITLDDEQKYAIDCIVDKLLNVYGLLWNRKELDDPSHCTTATSKGW